jgi:type IV secretory pathway VirB2 component (pilin)
MARPGVSLVPISSPGVAPGLPEGAGRGGGGRVAWVRPALLACGMLLAGASAAHAGTGGSDLPWNHPLQVVVDNLTGPTAKTIAALAFVLGGAMWMFTSHEQGAKRFGQALFGVAIVLGAVNLVDALGFQGATF